MVTNVHSRGQGVNDRGSWVWGMWELTVLLLSFPVSPPLLQNRSLFKTWVEATRTNSPTDGRTDTPDVVCKHTREYHWPLTTSCWVKQAHHEKTSAVWQGHFIGGPQGSQITETESRAVGARGRGSRKGHLVGIRMFWSLAAWCDYTEAWSRWSIQCYVYFITMISFS